MTSSCNYWTFHLHERSDSWTHIPSPLSLSDGIISRVPYGKTSKQMDLLQELSLDWSWLVPPPKPHCISWEYQKLWECLGPISGSSGKQPYEWNQKFWKQSFQKYAFKSVSRSRCGTLCWQSYHWAWGKSLPPHSRLVWSNLDYRMTPMQPGIGAFTGIDSTLAQTMAWWKETREESFSPSFFLGS